MKKITYKKHNGGVILSAVLILSLLLHICMLAPAVLAEPVTQNSTDPATEVAELSVLGVTGLSISPAFSTVKTAYTLNVSNDKALIEIFATASNSGGFVSIEPAGSSQNFAAKTLKKSVNLQVGKNVFNIVVAGSTESVPHKTYTLTVTRAAAIVNHKIESIKFTAENGKVVNVSPVYSDSTKNYTIKLDEKTGSGAIDIKCSRELSGTMTVNNETLPIFRWKTDDILSANITAGSGSKIYRFDIMADDGWSRSFNITVEKKTSSSIGSSIGDSFDGAEITDIFVEVNGKQFSDTEPLTAQTQSLRFMVDAGAAEGILKVRAHSGLKMFLSLNGEVRKTFTETNGVYSIPLSISSDLISGELTMEYDGGERRYSLLIVKGEASSSEDSSEESSSSDESDESEALPVGPGGHIWFLIVPLIIIIGGGATAAVMYYKKKNDGNNPPPDDEGYDDRPPRDHLFTREEYMPESPEDQPYSGTETGSAKKDFFVNIDDDEYLK